MRTKEKLIILLEALEVENIDKLIVCGTDTFEALGKEIAKRTKQLKSQVAEKDKRIGKLEVEVKKYKELSLAQEVAFNFEKHKQFLLEE